MAFSLIVIELAIVVATMISVTTLLCVGPRRLSAALRGWRTRFNAVTIPLTILATVLLIRWASGDVAPRISLRVLDNNITPHLYSLEGGLVASFQTIQHPLLSEFFVFVYMYAYVFLITIPFVLYFASADTRDLSSLVTAYSVNYAVGLVLYVLFIAYGPRNHLVVVDDLLYTTFPQARLLTGEVNQSSNVFPSLHASLSTTVAIFAWQTRARYPLWTAIAVPLAALVAFSTMYLGIHWASDVVAGIVLAVLSVHVGRRVDFEEMHDDVRGYVAARTRRYRDRYGG